MPHLNYGSTDKYRLAFCYCLLLEPAHGGRFGIWLSRVERLRGFMLAAVFDGVRFRGVKSVLRS